MSLLTSSRALAINPSTGGLVADTLCNDSIKISYCDLKKVNAKLVELEYEKKINANYKEIVRNDSISISSLRNKLLSVDRDYDRAIKNVKRERNILAGISVSSIILLILSIL